MVLMASQPEFPKAIWGDLDILVIATRRAKGREILAKYKQQFDATERAYGVDRYIIAAIWGIESNYSNQIGCLLSTSAAADEEDSVHPGRHRITKKKKNNPT